MLFSKAAGCARLAYNWGLEHFNSILQAGGKPNWMQSQKAFVALIPTKFPFLRDVPSAAYYQPFRHLNQAFRRFRSGIARRPVFKSKHRETPSFKVVKVRFTEGHVVIPVIGAVRIHEPPRFQGRIVSATVRADADRWLISVLFEMPARTSEPPPSTHEVVGIDLGLRAFATLSTGRVFHAPKPLKTHLRRLRRHQRSLSRRQKGSRRYQRARIRVARLHRRIRNIRTNFLHTLSTSIVREHQTIVIEDLHVRGMLRNHRLAQAISDASWSEFLRQLTYKSVDHGRTLLQAGRFIPTSKRCSRCQGHHGGLTLSDTVFQCPHCGYRCDRDVNAAQNLHTLAFRVIDARGELKALVSAGTLQPQPARGNVNLGAGKPAKKVLVELSA